MKVFPAVVVQWLHLLAFTAWVGGIIYAGFVLMPSLSALEASNQRKLMNAVSLRFTRMVWISVVVLLVTGIMKSAVNVPTFRELFTTPYGITLIAKHLLLTIMIILGLIVALVISPKLTLRSDTTAHMELSRVALKALKQLRKISVVNILLGFLVLLLSAILGTI